VQNGTISEHRDTQPFAFDDRRLPRLRQVAPADDLDPLAAQQVDRIE
jgi:hypothetical protein